ncbi:MAG: helix-turn-helix domain-containing protein [Patescibacteria group bacterium]
MDLMGLKEFGLSDNEAKVYSALFNIGKCKAGAVIKKSGLVRNSVYLSLDSLVNKKLINKSSEKGVFVFEICEPEAFLDVINEKKAKAERLVEYLQFFKPKVSSDIRIYEGMDNILLAREKILGKSSFKEMFLFGGSKYGSTEEMEKFWRLFHKKRIEKKIIFKILYDRTAPIENLEWRKNLPYTEVRYLPDQIESPTWFEVYGETSGIGIPGKNPILIVIKGAETAESLKKYFNYLWERGKYFI